MHTVSPIALHSIQQRILVCATSHWTQICNKYQKYHVVNQGKHTHTPPLHKQYITNNRSCLTKSYKNTTILSHNMSTQSHTTNVSKLIGLQYTEVTKQKVTATLTITNKLLQPYGLLHGGINALLGEELAHTGTLLHNNTDVTVTTVNTEAHHLTSARIDAQLDIVCTPIKIGRSLCIWQTTISTTQNNKTTLFSQCKCTVLITPGKTTQQSNKNLTLNDIPAITNTNYSVTYLPTNTQHHIKPSPLFQYIKYYFTECTNNQFTGEVIVTSEMLHPHTNTLHTGIPAILAEEVGSVSAAYNPPQTDSFCVGTLITNTFISAAYDGDRLFIESQPVKIGARTQLWRNNIYAQTGNQPRRLIVVSMLSTFNPAEPKQSKPIKLPELTPIRLQPTHIMNDCPYFAHNCIVDPQHQQFVDKYRAGTLLLRLHNFQITRVSAHRLEATVLVSSNMLQPFGLLHGGVNALLGEELAGMGAVLNAPNGTISGFNIDAYHLSGAAAGEILHLVATPIRMDDNIHVWQCIISANTNGKQRLVSVTTLTGMCKQGVVPVMKSPAFNITHDIVQQYNDISKYNAVAPNAYVDTGMQHFAERLRHGKLSAYAKMLNFQYTHVSVQQLSLQIILDQRHVQVYGILHGGINAVIAEELGSVLATINHPAGIGTPGTVGTWVEATHLNSATIGDIVQADCTVVKKGRRTQLWQINIYNQKTKKAIASCQLSTFNTTAGIQPNTKPTSSKL